MTRALVVYESVFGDTRTVAEAIAAGLAGRTPVDVFPAHEAPAEIGPDIGLLVIGVPTHGFTMPTRSSREGAVRQYGAQIEDISTGVHEWLDAVRVTGSDIAAAAFDTRMDHPKLIVKMNHATRVEEKLLRRLGLSIVAPAEAFVVIDAQGPLAAGEEERAQEWGRTLAAKLAPAGTS